MTAPERATTFGAHVRAARLQAGQLQNVVAERVGISAMYLNDMEHDRRNAPPDDLIVRLADALSLPVDVLWYAAGRIPADLRGRALDTGTIVRAFAALRRELER